MWNKKCAVYFKVDYKIFIEILLNLRFKIKDTLKIYTRLNTLIFAVPKKTGISEFIVNSIS